MMGQQGKNQMGDLMKILLEENRVEDAKRDACVTG